MVHMVNCNQLYITSFCHLHIFNLLDSVNSYGNTFIFKRALYCNSTCKYKLCLTHHVNRLYICRSFTAKHFWLDANCASLRCACDTSSDNEVESDLDHILTRFFSPLLGLNPGISLTQGRTWYHSRGACDAHFSERALMVSAIGPPVLWVPDFATLPADHVILVVRHMTCC